MLCKIHFGKCHTYITSYFPEPITQVAQIIIANLFTLTLAPPPNWVILEQIPDIVFQYVFPKDKHVLKIQSQHYFIPKLK